ncbi:MAG TPA: VanZ family protein [Gemmatimonadaceae bacterium]|nr:VanZ family protein [Gemmatimonadaceae bacterium]
MTRVHVDGSRCRCRWWLPAIIAVGILTATSWPTPPAMPHDSDKVVHFTSYALLGAAVAWAARVTRWMRAMFLIAAVSLAGAADEWHQQFIPGRATDVRDWLADTAGAVAGLSLVTALTRRREFVA